MSRIKPPEVSRRSVLRAAMAGAGVVLVQPLSGIFAEQATAAVNMPADSQATQKATDWLSKAVLPPGAVRSTSNPSPHFDLQWTEWWFAPAVVKTAYWTIAGISVAESANWLSAHPTAGLIVPFRRALPGPEVDVVCVGNVPRRGALEGIAYTVARTDGGVAVRAEVGVMPASAARPASMAAGSFGGPGQG